MKTQLKTIKQTIEELERKIRNYNFLLTNETNYKIIRDLKFELAMVIKNLDEVLIDRIKFA